MNTSNDSFRICELENFYFESEWIAPWSQLYEAPYIENVFKFLKDKLGKRFNDYYFVYYASCGNANPPQPIVLMDKRPKILIWSGDQTASVPSYMSKYFALIFKTHLNGDKENNGYFHLPLGYTKNLIGGQEIEPINRRKYDVFYSGNINKNRYELYKELNQISFLSNRLFAKLFHGRLNHFFPKQVKRYSNSVIQFTEGFAKGLNAEEYSYFMYNTKITINPPGFFRNETFRHYESLKAGAIPISLPLPDNFFYRKAPFEIINSWKELDRRVNYLLSNPNYMLEKQLKVIDWWENKCSEKSVADYMFQIIQKEILTN